MLEWKIKNCDDELKKEIKRTKDGFDDWYIRNWSEEYTKEQMLSENSPVERVYYKMTKTFEEVRKKYPEEALQRCSSCGKYVREWIGTYFSFCEEYGCGMSLCKKCAGILKGKIDKFQKE